MKMSSNNSSKNVLVVEDAFLVGIQLKEDIESLGYGVIGPANSVKKALMLLDQHPVNAAILDVNLGHEDSTPIAEKLENSNIPFLFITGYESFSEDKTNFGKKKLLRKPILLPDIDEAISALNLRD
jgi:two-component SAPR family response regulator